MRVFFAFARTHARTHARTLARSLAFVLKPLDAQLLATDVFFVLQWMRCSLGGWWLLIGAGEEASSSLTIGG